MKAISALAAITTVTITATVTATVTATQTTTLLAAEPERTAKAKNPAKHCLAIVEVTHRQVFMREPWRQRAVNKAWLVWQSKVNKSYGSTYNKSDDAQDKKIKCERVGFGQDKIGNVGTYVSCTLKATPCVTLINRPTKN